MIQENFKFYKPCELLQPYVRYYWVFKSDQVLNTYTFPICCPQIIFHKQDPLYIAELDTVQSRLTISGQVNFSSHLCADGVESLGRLRVGSVNPDKCTEVGSAIGCATIAIHIGLRLCRNEGHLAGSDGRGVVA